MKLQLLKDEGTDFDAEASNEENNLSEQKIECW